MRSVRLFSSLVIQHFFLNEINTCISMSDILFCLDLHETRSYQRSHTQNQSCNNVPISLWFPAVLKAIITQAQDIMSFIGLTYQTSRICSALRTRSSFAHLVFR
jgi:hypothetical protein